MIGTPDHPVQVGQRTVFGHRATIVGATIGDLCEVGNGAILMPGSRLGSGCILGEGTLVPAVVRAGACVKQRDRFGDRSILDGFPARLVGTLTAPPPVPGWALPPDAVATLRKVR